MLTAPEYSDQPPVWANRLMLRCLITPVQSNCRFQDDPLAADKKDPPLLGWRITALKKKFLLARRLYS
jgi:hypothetical protein